MQQGGQSIAAGSSPGIPQSQLIFTRAASTDAETAAPSGANNGEHGLKIENCWFPSGGGKSDIF